MTELATRAAGDPLGLGPRGDNDDMSVSPSQINTLVPDALRSGGIDPDDSAALRRVASIGLTVLMLRNTVWEEWHGEDWGLSDGEMMRSNSATVELVKSRLTVNDVDWAALSDAITNPERLLPDGRTLREYAGSKLRTLRGEAAAVARGCAAIEADSETRTALLCCGATALMFGSAWHGMPGWPKRVEKFCIVVDDPSDEHWHHLPLRDVGPRPDDIAVTEDLRRLLLDGPHLLSAAAAAWCVRAAIGYVTV